MWGLRASLDVQCSFAPVMDAGHTRMMFAGVKSRKRFWSKLSFRGLLREVRRLGTDVKIVCQDVLTPEPCNFIKLETLAQVFSCEFCKISKNSVFTKHLWTTASVVYIN